MRRQRGPLFDHHDPELGFVGAVDIAAQKVDSATRPRWSAKAGVIGSLAAALR